MHKLSCSALSTVRFSKKGKQRQNIKSTVLNIFLFLPLYLAKRNGWLLLKPSPSFPPVFSCFACGFCLFTYLCRIWASLTCRCTSRILCWYDRARGLWFPCHCCETPFRWWNCGAAVSVAHGGMLVSLWLSARLRRILTDERAVQMCLFSPGPYIFSLRSHCDCHLPMHVCICVHVWLLL